MSEWPFWDANIDAVQPSFLARSKSAPFCDGRRDVESDRMAPRPSPRPGGAQPARGGLRAVRDAQTGSSLYDEDCPTPGLYFPRGKGCLGGGDRVRRHRLLSSSPLDAALFGEDDSSRRGVRLSPFVSPILRVVSTRRALPGCWTRAKVVSRCLPLASLSSFAAPVKDRAGQSGSEPRGALEKKYLAPRSFVRTGVSVQ